MNTKFILCPALAITLSYSSISFGQFHQKDQNGNTTLSEAAAQPSNAIQSDAPILARGNQSGAILETDFARANRENLKIGFGQMDLSEATNWSRTTVHSDDSYTVTKDDESAPRNANGEVSMLKQETRARNTQLLMERFISLDEAGRPTDVLIYDGRKQLKYRGSLLYNRAGDFSEELLYDTSNTLLRRKIQPYDALGRAQKEKVILYVDNLPPGLQVIVVDEDEIETGQTTERIDWFQARRERKEMEEQARLREEGNSYPETVTEQKKERSGLGALLFGKNRKD